MTWLGATITAPRWVVGSLILQAWCFITLICVLAYAALSYAGSWAVVRGEAKFTPDEKYLVQQAYPDGRFISDDRLYEWCDGVQWQHINSKLDRDPTGRGCAKVR